MGRSKMCSNCRTRSRSASPASSSRHCKPPRSNSRRVGRPTTLPPTSCISALSHRPRKAGNEQIVKVLGHLGQAIERDRSYGPALGLAAICHADLDLAGWTDAEEANRSAGVALARRAYRVAGDYPDVLCNVAYVLAYFGEDIATATTLIDRALELKPSFAAGWWRSGWIRLMNGQPDLAIEHFEIGMRLNPRDILGFAPGIGAGHFFARRFEE